MPSSPDSATSVITSAVAIKVLDGTQSVSTAEPPRPSVSTRVTSPPSWLATSAASYPPGPPPMMTTRVTRRILPRGFRYPRGVQYAAYGSNLDPDQMTSRCPHSPLRSTGWLNGWRITFGGDGWDGPLPTVVEDPDSQVY